jgi:hypothetical protein
LHLSWRQRTLSGPRLLPRQFGPPCKHRPGGGSLPLHPSSLWQRCPGGGAMPPLRADIGADAVGGRTSLSVRDQPLPSRGGSHGPGESAYAALARAKHRGSPLVQSRTPARLVRRPTGPGDVTMVGRRPLERTPQGLTLGSPVPIGKRPADAVRNLGIRADDRREAIDWWTKSSPPSLLKRVCLQGGGRRHWRALDAGGRVGSDAQDPRVSDRQLPGG